MYLVTAQEMQEMDRLTIESFGIPGRILMENAGLGATRILLEKFDGLARKRVGVVAGRGNNGGDGFVIARYLFQKGINVSVFLLSPRDRVAGDAAANLTLLAPLNVPVIEMPDENAFSAHRTRMLRQDIWIDAILGTGLKSDVKGYLSDIINFINETNKPVFAVDIPSGLNANTGYPCGGCVRAHVTATFAFAKTGHILFPGAQFTGDLEIVDIGIPTHIAERVSPRQYCLTWDWVRDHFPPRSPDAHKGSTGHLLVVAGATGKTGAASMTAMSALRAGAGLVTLGIPERLNAVLESQVIEAMTCPLPDTENGMLRAASFDIIMKLLADKKCLAIGPGIGVSDDTRTIIQRLVQESTTSMVIDADGLNCLVGHTEILKNRKAPIILTPHPGEMARLMDTTSRHVQKDRITCAREFAKNFDVHVVLKGAKTVIAHPDGNVFVNPTGNAGMASGGMGDVLTGIIAGLIVQDFPPESASHAGVFLHGAAADALAETVGPFGFLATEVMSAVPEQISKLLS